MKQDNTYRLTLLYRQSRDGNTVENFRELCNNKEPTIAVGEVFDTEEILGRYYPIAWSVKTFIFALNENKDQCIIVLLLIVHKPLEKRHVKFQ